MRRRLIHRVKPRDVDLDRFQSRLTARLCVIFIAITQIGLRLLLVFAEPGLAEDSKISYLTSLPFLIVASLIVGIEFFLFKRIGSKIVKYSFVVDLLLLGIFLGEWVSTITASLVKIKLKQPPSFGVTALLGFTSFSWRTQIQPFIVQYWQLKIIPPVVAFGLVIGYSIAYDPEETIFTLCRGLLQVAYVIVLFYFEDKIQWKMLLANMQQERWVQINDFILNNIPENIAILDLEGHVKFTSDYLKAFMERCRCSQDLKEFFLKIRDLQQQADTDTSSSISASRIHMERVTTSAAFLDKEFDQKGSTVQGIDSLVELVLRFKSIIKEKYLRERSFLMYNGKLKTENRLEKSIEIKISYIQQQNSEFIIVIIRDTTHRDLLVTLEDNNKYKDQLLASVSHELRAPLNGNISLLEATIHSKEVPDNIKEHRIIPALRSSKYLLHIINDILDMSQIKAQKLRLVFQPENIKKTLINTIQLIELQAQKKGVAVLLEMEQGIPKNFCTDHVRLSQIVLNLLNNALKFTFEGVIKLIARPIEGLPWLKILVEDSGIGMSSDDMKKLFAGNFTRIDFQERDLINPAGVGLGLNIAYNLAELLGPKNHNEIQVKSIPSQGSTFSFIIENKEAGLSCQNDEDSLKVADEEKTEEAIDPKMRINIQSCYLTKSIRGLGDRYVISPADEEAQPCDCAKVLIVDDNPFNTLAFESILGPLEIKSDSVFDGKSAIEKVVNRQRHLCGDDCKPYSVVFMDQEMPGMTGSEVVKELRRLQEESIIPTMKIIGCTAHGGKEEVERFLKSGIDECIQKPISKQLIMRILKECELR